MHLIMIAIAIAIALLLRVSSGQSQGNWSQRWHKALFSFLFPPLILLMTALAVLCMGTQGQMLGIQASWLGYCLVLGFIAIASVTGIKLAYQGWQSCQAIERYPEETIAGKAVKILDTDLPYSAQIGFWRPKLIVSRGLLETLDSIHLEAVFAHEQAHYDCRDTFWFFWLGWLRSFTSWLPNTEYWWQELLLLREVRADRKASDRVDGLVLAESLLMVVRAPLRASESFCATFHGALSGDRLTERIDAVLAMDESPVASRWWCWSWLLLVLLPWMTIPLHYCC